MNKICADVQFAQEQRKSKTVYDNIRKITESRAATLRTIKSANGKILFDPEEVKSRWKDYFEALYNDSNPVDESVPSEILSENSTERDTSGNTEPDISRDEIVLAIKCLKQGKSPGLENTTSDEIKAAGEIEVDVLHYLCKQIWTTEKYSENWRKAIIVPIYKKQDKLCCDNYRGISLLCHSEKIIASVILNRIRQKTGVVLSEAQAGFRLGRSTIDQLFTLRQLTEKYTEYNKIPYICYMDFKKVFDSIWSKGLWQIMRHLGYPEKIVRLLEKLYEKMLSAVRVDGDITEWFGTLVGVLQD